MCVWGEGGGGGGGKGPLSGSLWYLVKHCRESVTPTKELTIG